MRQPLMIRQRNEDGTLGPPVKAFPNEKTQEEISRLEIELLRQQVAENDKLLLEFIEHMMDGGEM